MSSSFPQTWDLESLFPGGSKSPVLLEHNTKLESALVDLQERMTALPLATDGAATEQWVQAILGIQDAYGQLVQGSAFIGCLTADDVKDRKAKLLEGRNAQLFAEYHAVMNLLDGRILGLAEADWQALLADERLKPITFVLQERRELAKRRMTSPMETLAGDLAVDGYHAWGQLYSTVVGRIEIPYTEDGETAMLSVGQAANKFSSPDRPARARLFADWEIAWGREAEVIASALNHIGGFRLSLYKHRGWNSILQEPMAMNRMSEETLEAMWEAVQTGKSRLVDYLNRKARLLQADQVHWYDLSAPVGNESRTISYDEAASLITEQFAHFSPDLATFANRAFRSRWIEAEDRPGKAPGGFCTVFPQTSESRIFMTYGNDWGGVRTLAHELGHAYHSQVMFDLPLMAQEYAMNVAETASTFAEMQIGAAAIRRATSVEEQISLLDGRLSEAVSYLMNIHARFLFETRFYAERRKGQVGIEQLNELMETAQREAYADALGTYHPHFWASKGHFYGTDVPFYNFPYTFGYLFSAGIYAQAQAEGPSFERRYVDLLRDTGRMNVEDLAARHLGADLRQTAFWTTGVKLALADVDQFLALTE